MILNYSDSPVITKDNCPSIFLAGPTPRSKNIKSWREDAINILKQLKFDGIVYIPECDFSSSSFNYNEQVYWEWEAMEEADIIAFWVPRSEELPGFTTNVEFGYWIAKNKFKVYYGRPNDAIKNEYLDKLYDWAMYGVLEPSNSLQNLLSKIVKDLNDFKYST